MFGSSMVWIAAWGGAAIGIAAGCFGAWLGTSTMLRTAKTREERQHAWLALVTVVVVTLVNFVAF